MSLSMSGDDTDVWGLHISPDIDSITYGLSGKLDSVRGWGLKDESFRCLEEIEEYGMPAWFRLAIAISLHTSRAPNCSAPGCL